MLLAYPPDIAVACIDQRQSALHSLLEQAAANPTALSSRWPGVVKPQNHMLRAVLKRTKRVRMANSRSPQLIFQNQIFYSTKPSVRHRPSVCEQVLTRLRERNRQLSRCEGQPRSMAKIGPDCVLAGVAFRSFKKGTR